MKRRGWTNINRSLMKKMSLLSPLTKKSNKHIFQIINLLKAMKQSIENASLLSGENLPNIFNENPIYSHEFYYFIEYEFYE